jgi:hypothetical protein
MAGEHGLSTNDVDGAGGGTTGCPEGDFIGVEDICNGRDRRHGISSLAASHDSSIQTFMNGF